MGAAWLSAIAGATLAFGVIWARIVRPLARGCREALDVLHRILEVVEQWPIITASVTSHTGELSALAMHVGAIDLREQELREQVDALIGTPPRPPSRTPRKAVPR